jgi:hypothetical protein
MQFYTFWQLLLEVAAWFLRIGDPAAEGGQVVFVPALGGREVEGVLGVVPDVKKKAHDTLLGPGEGDALGETSEIRRLEIRRQVVLNDLVGDSVERCGDLTPFFDSGHGRSFF